MKYLAAVAALVVLAACGSGGSKSEADTEKCGSGASCATHGMDSPEAYAYDACQQASFTSDGGFVPEVKDTLKWPDLDSKDVTVTGSGIHYHVVANPVGYTPVGAHVTWRVTCDATRRPGNRWEGVAQVPNPTPVS